MTLRLAVLGDSIGYGTGATRTADTLAPRLAADLTSGGRPTTTRVFAVPGAVSEDLAAQVARAASWQPDVAVIVIGANDLSCSVPPARAAEQLRQAVRALRKLGAQVVVAPAPDLSIVPYVPATMQAPLRAASTQLRHAQAHAVLAEGGLVADREAHSVAAFGANSALFCSDGFHPSSAGYAVIAAALAPAVRQAVGPLDQAG